MSIDDCILIPVKWEGFFLLIPSIEYFLRDCRVGYGWGIYQTKAHFIKVFKESPDSELINARILNYKETGSTAQQRLIKCLEKVAVYPHGHCSLSKVIDWLEANPPSGLAFILPHFQFLATHAAAEGAGNVGYYFKTRQVELRMAFTDEQMNRFVEFLITL